MTENTQDIKATDKYKDDPAWGELLAKSITNSFELIDGILGVKLCRKDAQLPVVSKGNAGIDLRVLTQNGEDKIEIPANGTYIFNTGIKMDIPEGYYIEVVPRSSTGIKKTLRLMNTCGILDSSWKGETLVAIHNFGETPVTVENNERLCQMIIHKVHEFKIVEVDDVGKSERGEKGFGSTGRF